MLVDSEPEVSFAALDAACSFDDGEWRAAVIGREGQPQLEEKRRAALLAALRRTRPALVRGYEAVVMARLLAEALDEGGHHHVDATVARILSDWPTELDAAMTRFGFGGGGGESGGESTTPSDISPERRAPLEKHFERRRKEALTSRPDEFFALNVPYASRGDALRSAVGDADAAGPLYFVSSKKAERVSALLQRHFPGVGGVEDHEASPRLFCSLLPPEEQKVRALREIMQRPVASRAERLHFVDDRLDTLLAVAEDEELRERYTLYLASYGYCSPAEVEEARRRHSGVVRILRSPDDLVELLRWGLFAGGVNDGCEPTEEEKQSEGWLSS